MTHAWPKWRRALTSPSPRLNKSCGSASTGVVAELRMGRRAIVVLLALAACGDDLAAADTDGGTTTDIGTTGSETLGASGATGTVGDASSSTEASTTSMDPTDATEESSGGAETSGGPVACVTADDCDPGSCELATCEDGACVYEDDPDEEDPHPVSGARGQVSLLAVVGCGASGGCGLSSRRRSTPSSRGASPRPRPGRV